MKYWVVGTAWWVMMYAMLYLLIVVTSVTYQPSITDLGETNQYGWKTENTTSELERVEETSQVVK